MNTRTLLIACGIGLTACGSDAGHPATTETGGSTTGSTTSSGGPGGGGGAGGAGTTSSGTTSSGTGGAGTGATATSSTGSTSTTGTGASTTSSSSSSGGTCTDTCPAPKGGITLACEKRFLYGVNYAWSSFGGDFGGITSYGGGGVSTAKAARLADLQDMAANGVDVVRWWMFPDLRGDAIQRDTQGSPTGIGGTLTADITAALDLAEQAGVYLHLTLFSFDAFKPDPVHSANLADIVNDASKQSALITKVINPVVAAVNASPNKDRLHSWDVINEPEWATSGNDGTDQDFSPNAAPTTPIPYATMKSFVTAVVTALHAASDRPVTVGGAAIKWAHAWGSTGIDFYTFHMYDWINMYYPYTTPLANYGVTDKPVVLGEFPVSGLTGVTYSQLVTEIFNLGYAGAMGWAENDPSFPWAPNKANVKAFASQEGCVVKY